MTTIISDEMDLEQRLAEPGPWWLFKHSNACGISTAAHAEFERFLQSHPDERAAMVVIQENRPLSNAIAKRLGRVHQSPQLLRIVDGAVVWQASHWSITMAALEQALTEHA